MKKLFCVVLSIVLLFSGTVFASSSKKDFLPSDELITMEETINSLFPSEMGYAIEGYRFLFSASGEYNYLFLKLYPSGYAVYNLSSNVFEEISPYSQELPIDISTSDNFVFLMPGEYAVQKESIVYDLVTDERVSDELIDSYIELQQKVTTAEADRNRIKQDSDLIPKSNEEINATRSGYTLNTYITNSSYFTSLLGESFGNNTDGTCTAIACAILLGYYDVYVNNNYVTDQYRTGYGTTESFHQVLRYLFNSSGGPAGISAATGGINEYYLWNTSISASCVTGNSSSVWSRVLTKVITNRPVVTAMFTTRGATWNHTAVTYGFSRTFDSSDECTAIYYFVHMGWHSSNRLKTLNYLWFADALNMSQ